MPKSYYPPKSLREAEVAPRTILESGGGKPMLRLTVAKELNLKSGARAFRDLITASGGYGLTRGSYTAEYIELQDRGRQLVAGDLDAVYDALFSQELFGRFHDQFKGAKLPSDWAAYDFLKRECGVPETQVKRAYSRLLKDAREWHIVQDVSGVECVVPVEMARQQAATELGAVEAAKSLPEEVLEASAESKRLMRGLVGDLGTGFAININIQLALPETTDETVYENLFASLEKHVLQWMERYRG